MTRTVRTRPLVAGAIALTALVLSALLIVPAQPAWAAASVTVSSAQGGSNVDPDYATDITVTGAGFQSITKGFGGVYVLFGWVDSGWRPSQGGVVGADYRYVPDSEAADNAGYQRFIAFPGSETEGAAHAIMGADGSWQVSMVIPGAEFQSQDREGKTSVVDCLEVTCGIITIGAHGVKNANNETFTPLTFTTPAAGAGTDAAATAPAAVPAAAAPGAVRVGLAAAEVQAGNSVVFTGQGFTPGEQVVATLDDGAVAVGPLTAGTLGDVAGALPTPRDTRTGTHVVTLRGAASGVVAQSEVAIVAASSMTVAPAAAPDETPVWLVAVLGACIVIALVLIIATVVTAWQRGRPKRREARARRRAERAGPVPAKAADSTEPASTQLASTEHVDTELASAESAPTEIIPTGAGAPR